jgi:hypothetical protein
VSSLADLPFVIAPPGDPTAVVELAERAALAWHLPTPTLLRTGMNALFTAGDVVLRVGRPTSDPYDALWLGDRLHEVGIRSPRFVRDDVIVDHDLAVFAIALETSVGPIVWREVGEMVARVHTLDPAMIADHHPLPACRNFPWWDFPALLAATADLLDDASRAGIERAIRRHDRWWERSEQHVVCHGDVHPGNVVQTNEGPVLLDWDLLCLGPTAWDHGPMMTMAERWGGAVGEYEEFAAGYGRSMRGDPLAEALAELRLVAATLMRVRAGRTDPVAALEAERRLRWWRGEADAPVWRAQ